jgi:hypothetical protein
MKTEEDEAFDDLAKKQGSWGGGFPAKRRMAADKQHWNEDEWRRNNWRCGHGWLRGEQCEICNASQPAQEPVAWAVQGCSKMWRGEFAEIDAKAEAKRIGGTCVAYALYISPPQREWVGLTDAEIDAEANSILTSDPVQWWRRFACAVLAKSKEKNT